MLVFSGVIIIILRCLHEQRYRQCFELLNAFWPSSGRNMKEKNYSLPPTFRYFKATGDPIIRESDLLHKTGISGNTISLSGSYSKPQIEGGATIYMSERQF